MTTKVCDLCRVFPGGRSERPLEGDIGKVRFCGTECREIFMQLIGVNGEKRKTDDTPEPEAEEDDRRKLRATLEAMQRRLESRYQEAVRGGMTPEQARKAMEHLVPEPEPASPTSGSPTPPAPELKPPTEEEEPEEQQPVPMELPREVLVMPTVSQTERWRLMPPEIRAAMLLQARVPILSALRLEAEGKMFRQNLFREALWKIYVQRVLGPMLGPIPETEQPHLLSWRDQGIILLRTASYQIVRSIPYTRLHKGYAKIGRIAGFVPASISDYQPYLILEGLSDEFHFAPRTINSTSGLVTYGRNENPKLAMPNVTPRISLKARLQGDYRVKEPRDMILILRYSDIVYVDPINDRVQRDPLSYRYVSVLYFKGDQDPRNTDGEYQPIYFQQENGDSLKLAAVLKNLRALNVPLLPKLLVLDFSVTRTGTQFRRAASDRKKVIEATSYAMTLIHADALRVKTLNTNQPDTHISDIHVARALLMLVRTYTEQRVFFKLHNQDSATFSDTMDAIGHDFVANDFLQENATTDTHHYTLAEGIRWVRFRLLVPSDVKDLPVPFEEAYKRSYKPQSRGQWTEFYSHTVHGNITKKLDSTWHADQTKKYLWDTPVGWGYEATVVALPVMRETDGGVKFVLKLDGALGRLAYHEGKSVYLTPEELAKKHPAYQADKPWHAAPFGRLTDGSSAWNTAMGYYLQKAISIHSKVANRAMREFRHQLNWIAGLTPETPAQLPDITRVQALQEVVRTITKDPWKPATDEPRLHYSLELPQATPEELEYERMNSQRVTLGIVTHYFQERLNFVPRVPEQSKRSSATGPDMNVPTLVRFLPLLSEQAVRAVAYHKKVERMNEIELMPLRIIRVRRPGTDDSEQHRAEMAAQVVPIACSLCQERPAEVRCRHCEKPYCKSCGV